MSKRSRNPRYRPKGQILETRRYMAADLGFNELAATPEEPAQPVWENPELLTNAEVASAERVDTTLHARAGGGIETHDGVLDLVFQDAGGDPYWVINGLEIRPGTDPGRGGFEINGFINTDHSANDVNNGSDAFFAEVGRDLGDGSVNDLDQGAYARSITSNIQGSGGGVSTSDSSSKGWSWRVLILPQMEQQN